MQELRTVLELIYFVSAGPLLLIVAIIGLWQLKIAKDTARLQAKRAALSLSAERCEYYHTRVIPLINKLDQAVIKNDIKYFELCEFTIEGQEIKTHFNCTPEVFKTELEKSDVIVDEVTEALNAMEAFSVFFISKVADETIAFSSVGRTYCNTAKRYMADIVVATNHGGHYSNLLKLFLIWNSRHEAEQLMRDRKTIEKKLEKLERKCLLPVGTE